MVGQIVDLHLKQLTFGGIQLEAMHPQVVKDYPHPLEMFCMHLGVDDHIIQVDETVGQVQLAKVILHQPLESRWSITQPKG